MALFAVHKVEPETCWGFDPGSISELLCGSENTYVFIKYWARSGTPDEKKWIVSFFLPFSQLSLNLDLRVGGLLHIRVWWLNFNGGSTVLGVKEDTQFWKRGTFSEFRFRNLGMDPLFGVVDGPTYRAQFENLLSKLWNGGTFTLFGFRNLGVDALFGGCFKYGSISTWRAH